MGHGGVGMRNPFISNPEINRLLSAGNVDEAMGEKLTAPKSDRLKSFFLDGEQGKEHQEGALYAGMTLGDFLYDYVRIDPTVVEGVDFARSEDLHSIFKFSVFSERFEAMSGEELAGNSNQMQGYVAERLVAHHLEAQGHDVVFPSTSNQEGWDVLVDGAPFQIKSLASADGVHEHLQRFHDIPVIVNAELADKVGHLDNVYVDPLLQHDQVLELTQESIHYGQELSDFEIPWISLAVSSAASVRDLITNQTDVSGAVINTVSNAAGRIVLGKVGSVTSGMVGLFLLGPAGSVIFSGVGAVVGAYWGRKAATSFRSMLVDDLEKQVCEVARDCAAMSHNAMQRKLLAWRNKQEIMKVACTSRYSATAAAGSYFDKRIAQDILYFENKAHELNAIASGTTSGDPRALWERLVLLTRRAGIHPHCLQDGFKRLRKLLEELKRERRKYQS